MNDFIDLPHLPECLLGLPLETIHEIHSHTYHAIKADRQLRGDPVAYFQNSNSTNGKPPQYEQVCESAKNDPDVFPLYAAPQPAEINIDYKALYEKMCERCDYLDAKLAEYSEQPDTPAQEPSDNEMAVIWDQIHASFGREPFRVSHVDYSRALLARYGNHHVEQPSAAAPKFGEEE